MQARHSGNRGATASGLPIPQATGEQSIAGDGRQCLPMFIVECRRCGFEPQEQTVMPRGLCPKCYGWAWHRLPRPGHLVRPPAA